MNQSSAFRDCIGDSAGPVCTVFSYVSSEKDTIAQLAKFLSHYRNLGALRFVFLVDDSDGWLKKLADDTADVCLTKLQGVESPESIRVGMNKARDEYGDGSWCLTVQPRELFKFPLSDTVALDQFVEYLDAERFQGVYSIQLEMIDNGDLAQNGIGSSISSPFERDLLLQSSYIQHVDYLVQEISRFPFFSVCAAPLAECEFEGDGSKVKFPLIKWKRGMENNGASISERIRLADVITCVMHFPDLKVDSELSNSVGIEYQGSRQLLELGFNTLSKKYLRWAGMRFNNRELRIDSQKLDSYRPDRESSLLDGRRELANYSEWMDIWNCYLADTKASSR